LRNFSPKKDVEQLVLVADRVDRVEQLAQAAFRHLGRIERLDEHAGAHLAGAHRVADHREAIGTTLVSVSGTRPALSRPARPEVGRGLDADHRDGAALSGPSPT
jgi:hypothetical protein